MLPSTLLRVGLVADDLTGAGDAAVQFTAQGWRTLLVLDPAASDLRAMAPAHELATVFAVSTDSRALPHRKAADATAAAVTRLMRATVGRLFVKIDSTMRGSVAGQITGALDAWRAEHPDARAVVCPAYPKMGRTVQGNRLFVHNEPVDVTVYGRDPVTPVRTSRMAELLPRSTPGVLSVDATTDEDLGSIAAAISRRGPATIGVGSGGLAGALARAWTEGYSFGSVERVHLRANRKDRVCVQVSSLNPVSHAQAAMLSRTYPDVRVLIGAPERTRGVNVAESLAEQLAAIIEAGECDVVGLVGGDGARAALRWLGASAIHIGASLIEGVPLGTIIGGVANGKFVFTKAGGFGNESALVEVVEKLTV